MKDAEDLAWLVQRRSEVMSLAMRLYKIATEEPEGPFPPVLQLLLGAVFSLWRAVFLADAQRPAGEVSGQALEFISTLIEDNAINYRQDKAANAWTVGYYLNNAFFRLDLAYEKLKATTERSVAIKAFLDQQRRSGDPTPNPREDWTTAYAAAEEVLQLSGFTPAVSG